MLRWLKRYILIGMFLISGEWSYGQNLVPNPGFETIAFAQRHIVPYVSCMHLPGHAGPMDSLTCLIPAETLARWSECRRMALAIKGLTGAQAMPDF